MTVLKHALKPHHLLFPLATLFALTAVPIWLILRGTHPALIAADAAWWVGAAWLGSQMQTRALLTAVDLIALLLLVMGGRSLRAAVGGHVERQGIARRDQTRRRYVVCWRHTHPLPSTGCCG